MQKLSSLLLINLPSLQIIFPILMAVLCCFFSSGYITYIISLFATFATLYISFNLFSLIIQTQSVSYNFGGWKVPIGIEYKIDLLGGIFLLLFSFLALVTIIYSYRAVIVEIAKEKISLFYSLLLISFAGYLGIFITNDIFNFYVFLEIASIASYGLIAMGKNKMSSFSSYGYLIVGTIAATFILLGIGMIYMMVGTLNMSDIAAKVSLIKNQNIFVFGAILFILGCLVKAALFPVHSWLPNIYANSPSTVNVFLSSVSSNAAFYILIKFLFVVIDIKDFVYFDYLKKILLVIAISSVLYGSIAASFQTCFKRILAYSSITVSGYIVFAIVLGLKAGIITILFFMINNALVKATLFIIIGLFEQRIGKFSLIDLKGIGRKYPLIAIFIIINLGSLAGIPMTLGFLAKWYLIQNILAANIWYIIPIIISSLITVFYSIKIIEILFLRNNKIEKKKFEFSRTEILLILVLTIMNIFLGSASNKYLELLKELFV